MSPIVARALLVVSLVAWTSSARAAPDALTRAKEILDAQLPALVAPHALGARMAPSAVIVGNGSTSLAHAPEAAAILATLAAPRRTPGPVVETIVSGVVAGRAGRVLWLRADVSFARALPVLPDDGAPQLDVTRAWLTELVLDDGGAWKIMALAFTSTSGASAPSAPLPPAGVGPLTALLAAPSRLEDALRGDHSTVAVLDEAFGVGRESARDALAAWRRGRPTVRGAFEVHDAAGTWGLVTGELELPSARRAHVLVLALANHRRWSVVAVHAMTDELLAKIVRGPDTNIRP